MRIPLKLLFVLTLAALVVPMAITVPPAFPNAMPPNACSANTSAPRGVLVNPKVAASKSKAANLRVRSIGVIGRKSFICVGQSITVAFEVRNIGKKDVPKFTLFLPVPKQTSLSFQGIKVGSKTASCKLGRQGNMVCPMGSKYRLKPGKKFLVRITFVANLPALAQELKLQVRTVTRESSKKDNGATVKIDILPRWASALYVRVFKPNFATCGSLGIAIVPPLDSPVFFFIDATRKQDRYQASVNLNSPYGITFDDQGSTSFSLKPSVLRDINDVSKPNFTVPMCFTGDVMDILNPPRFELIADSFNAPRVVIKAHYDGAVQSWIIDSRVDDINPHPGDPVNVYGG